MSRNDSIKKIREEKEEWEGKTLKPALQRFKLKESPTRFYSPLDAGEGFEFLGKVGKVPAVKGYCPGNPTFSRKSKLSPASRGE